MIPIYQPNLSGNERKYVNECLDTTWISSKGKFVAEFETAFSNYVGIQNSTTTSNGTVALHLALLALGIGPGDEVIVPTLTYIASVNSIVYTGATPIFVDSISSSWQIDPSDIEKKITNKTKAIMVVHLYGLPCDMDSITALASKYNLFIIEDCAEAIGTRYKGKHVGTFGEIATFSFFGNKTITTGEGGMVCTSDSTLYERAVHFKGQGLATHRQYWHDVIGYNYRMTNICAAIGMAQLERIDNILLQKREIAEFYQEAFKNLPIIFHSEEGDVTHSYWMCSIALIDDRRRDDLRRHLSDRGIETRPVFYPVHTMPMYAEKYQRCPVAEKIGRSGINLPSWPGLSFEQLSYITNEVSNFF